jgi:hypothetical protein
MPISPALSVQCVSTNPFVLPEPKIPGWYASENPAGDAPDLPNDLVGENGKPGGTRVNTDLPADAFDDTVKGLTNGNLSDQDGQKICPNGVRIRRSKDGPRVDIPANGDKPNETIHFPASTLWPF